ncbi:glutathione S-transferase-like isoform X2 [Podarcis raffonei]|uniref:glutathione S-transferase-like isoform X2 n=1 Tax=Podarcis raffonei TaxID=65483 RepID=UPI0023298085|nr:glutathione S-transferase-like isoform X2 [Podarcis raffonei]
MLCKGIKTLEESYRTLRIIYYNFNMQLSHTGIEPATLALSAPHSTQLSCPGIDMYVEGTTDLMGMIRVHHKSPPGEKEKNLSLIIERATKRYFPVYEKVLKENGHPFLLGNQWTWADVQLIETLLMAEEKESTILSQFPLLQAFKARMCDVPTIKKFLQPGSPRKPPPDEKFVTTANRVFNRK